MNPIEYLLVTLMKMAVQNREKVLVGVALVLAISGDNIACFSGKVNADFFLCFSPDIIDSSTGDVILLRRRYRRS